MSRVHQCHAHTDLFPFCFCHPKLIVAQEEGPDSLPDLMLDPTVVDQPQQLLVLIALWEGSKSACTNSRDCSPSAGSASPAWPQHLPVPGVLPDPHHPHTHSLQMLSDLHLELSSARGSCRWTFGEMLALYSQKASHQSYPRSLLCLCAPEECPNSAGPTVLSSRYFCHMSTVSPELALQGTSGDTMLWLTRAERWVRTVERCLQ